jgi:membrane-associated protease RseP (regulator of RpoE activity)
MILLYSLVIIIFLHELGHLLAAKLFKCGVKTFSVGFGKPLFVFKTKKTNYQIAPILLGGYCELQDELKYTRSKYSFTNKTYIQKVIISYAGIGMNCWSALIAYGIFLLTGNATFVIFGFYSTLIGLSNAIPIPALDGSYPIAFLFERRFGKRKCYEKIQSLFGKWFKWIMILNLLSIPYLVWIIFKGQIL